MASNDILLLIRWAFHFSPTLTKANISDDQGLIEMLSHNLDYFRAKPVNIPHITILLDNGYHERDNYRSLAKTLSPNHDQDPV
ncbi:MULTISPECIES: hypothetical protein [unclassified Microcoleus]|uniref:hypothetical protein n=1 Tax=unclassified Microcoleus TaxID=2642155 RepID=UPI002FD5FE6C